MKFTIKYIAACAVLLTTAGVYAQTSIHQSHGSSNPTPANYAGQQNRTIKALSEQETKDWMDGKGMGLSKAAELNSYPGPSHVLELQQPLQLTAGQRESSIRLMAMHKDQVRKLGAQMVQAETELDLAFATRSIDASKLSATMKRIGELHTAIRESHLQTHLTQTAMLSPTQIVQYNTLRGYGTGAASSDGHSAHKH